MTTIDPVWVTRRDTIGVVVDSLKNDIDDRLKTIPSQSRESLRLTAIQNILEGLRQYGLAKFDYFRDAFTNDHLTPSTDHSADEVLRVTLEQMAYDLDVLYRAADPRVMSCGPGSTLDPTLAKADDLVCSALTPAISGGWLDGPVTAITYYQKSPYIRSIPYASAALIAIPYTCARSARDFLSIPHEVGHYVFRNGHQPSGVTLPVSLQHLANYCKEWREEIFADIYGCLVAGPIMALDFQDLQHADSRDDLIHNDGQHPISGLRPYAYTDILRHSHINSSAWGQGLGVSWAQALDNEWESYLQDRQFDAQVAGAPADNVIKVVGLDNMREEVKAAIDQFFWLGLDKVPVSKWDGINWPMVIPTQCQTIYTDFESAMNNQPPSSSPQCYQPIMLHPWTGPAFDPQPVSVAAWQKAWLEDGWTSLPTEQNWLPK